MNYKQMNSPLVKTLLFGSIVLLSVMYVSFISKNPDSKQNISYDEAMQLVKSKDVREINIQDDEIYFLGENNAKFKPSVSQSQKIELLSQGNALNISVTLNDDPPLSFYFFQLLFWLFFISPPVIVILLFVIIRKMDAKK